MGGARVGGRGGWRISHQFMVMMCVRAREICVEDSQLQLYPLLPAVQHALAEVAAEWFGNLSASVRPSLTLYW